MSASSKNPDLNAVLQLVESAGEGLAARFRQDAQALSIQHKGPRDLVTVADRESEAVLLRGLQSRFPGTGFLSEEVGLLAEAQDATEGAASTGERWIIDPLDGTTNFAHGHPFFSISVALHRDGEPILGVIHAPVLGETFWAARGEGAHRRSRPGGPTEPMTVCSETQLDKVMLATGFSYSRREVDDGGLSVFGVLLRQAREIRRAGSACLDLAYTAAGVFGGFWEYNLQPHDVAAGILLVTEAGGVVTDVAGGQDHIYGGSIVAGSAAIHAAVRQALAEGPRHPGGPPTPTRAPEGRSGE